MSKKYCCVPGCVESGESHQVLHVFPNPNKHLDRFRSWVHAVGGEIVSLENDFIYKNRRVCHRHFEEKHCCRFNKLSQLAVPRIYLPGLSTVPRYSLSAQRLVRPLQNIEDLHNIPSTSKVSEQNDQYAMDSSPKHHLLQISEEAGENDENKENNPAIIIAQDKTHVKSSSSIQQLEKKSCNLLDFNKKKKTTAARVPVFKKGSKLTSNEYKLYVKLLQVRNKLSKLRNKSKKQSANIKAAMKITSNTAFLSTLESFTSSAKILTLMQFREYKKKNKGRRFSLEEKILALSIFKQTPKGYRYLRKIYVLPAPQTLAKLISQANLKPGINKNIFSQLKKVAEKMKVQERLCLLMFDEMYLKANISYNERRDRVSGFVSNGTETKPEFADHAQVFMVRGLFKNYKQPVSYTFSAASTKGQELAVQIKSVTTELQKAGFIIVSTICDQGSNNRQAIKLLLQETRGDYLKKNLVPKDQVIVINGQEIIPLYDPPHLLKCIRNNLLTKNLLYVQNNIKKTAKWEHITLLHNENPGYKGVRLIPKLTDNHVIPQKISKMKVKYASQIFSRTVASNMGYLADKGILPKECRETADILLFFDNLFDSCNGSHYKKEKIHGKPLLGPATPTSTHHNVWLEGKKMLENMKFVHPVTGKVENVPTLTNWAWTLEGFEILLKKMNNDFGITSVWMRHLNQDPIENFFGAIRSHGCRNNNPTCDKFEGAFTSLLINNVSSVHAPGNNCENDLCQNLSVLLINKDIDCKATMNIEIMPDIEIKSVNEKTDPRVLGALQYVTGYFIRNCKRKIFKNCKNCKADLIAIQGTEYIKYREYAGRQWLCSPTEPVIECLSNIQEITNFIIKKYLFIENVKEFIKTFIFMFVTFNFINCREHKDAIIDFILNSSTKFYIFNYCKEVNKILCGRQEEYDEDDEMQTKAKKYFKKCFKRPNK